MSKNYDIEAVYAVNIVDVVLLLLECTCTGNVPKEVVRWVIGLTSWVDGFGVETCLLISGLTCMGERLGRTLSKDIYNLCVKMDGQQRKFERENGIPTSIHLLQKDGLRNRGMLFIRQIFALWV